MKVTKTPLQDCLLIETTTYGDGRGFFLESFNKHRLHEATGIEFDIKQVNFAGSSKNVLRGLHYQDAPYSQTKLIGVTKGAVMDVVVDLRKYSPTFLKHFKVIIDNPGTLLLVPRGFAHGYHSLTDETLFYYFVDAPYSPNYEKGIYYNDPEMGIDWELEAEPIVSEKDLNQPRLAQVSNNF